MKQMYLHTVKSNEVLFRLSITVSLVNWGGISFPYAIKRRFQVRDYAASDGRITDELERIWKEAVMVYSKYCTDICPKGPRKTAKSPPQCGEPVYHPRFELSISRTHA